MEGETQAWNSSPQEQDLELFMEKMDRWFNVWVQVIEDEVVSSLHMCIQISCLYQMHVEEMVSLAWSGMDFSSSWPQKDICHTLVLQESQWFQQKWASSPSKET